MQKNAPKEDTPKVRVATLIKYKNWIHSLTAKQKHDLYLLLYKS